MAQEASSGAAVGGDVFTGQLQALKTAYCQEFVQSFMSALFDPTSPECQKTANDFLSRWSAVLKDAGFRLSHLLDEAASATTTDKQCSAMEVFGLSRQLYMKFSSNKMVHIA